MACLEVLTVMRLISCHLATHYRQRQPGEHKLWERADVYDISAKLCSMLD